MDSSTKPAPQSAIEIPPLSMTAPRQWSTGLCDCCKDCSSCCLTCWCPFITFGQIAEIVDKGTISCAMHATIYCLLSYTTGCECVYSYIYRSKLRQQYMLPEQPCNDCLVHCCCECCALCQEYRELKHLGFNPSLGWEGNPASKNERVVLPVMPPAVPGEMER
ncbi:hypothetical protein M8C21_029918 [Ambrosia artemisiifolia]|uniref:Uncharacterized protein n=1 Tax=Ambrosia artemisiifolia TaxID=4212 RepID=A0AAD5CQ55_AMBAR|nr:hypothetical protein M8C21_029918 [Ambrosia artemisiifolia]